MSGFKNILLAGLILLSTAHFLAPAWADQWELRGGLRRHKVIVRRYLSILEKYPAQNYAFKKLIKLARKWPGLERLAARYAQKVKKNPKNWKYRLLLGHFYQKLNRPADAEREYRKAVEIRSDSYLALRSLALHLYREQKYSEAFQFFRQALKYARGREAKLYLLRKLAVLSLNLKRNREAENYWRELFKLFPNNLKAREEAARLLTEHKLYSKAEKEWKFLIRRTRNPVKKSRYLRKLGDLYREWGKWKEAVAAYRKAMSLTRPGHWLRRELLSQIVQLYREKSQLYQLVKELQREKNKSPYQLAVIAKLLDELGRDREAEKAYRIALKKNPYDSQLRMRYAVLLEVLSRWDEAVKQYKILVRQNPRSAHYRFVYAEFLSRLGKSRESLIELKKISKIFSNNPAILNRLASIYSRRRMDSEAVEIYRKLLRLDPKNPEYYLKLGQFYIKRKKPALAEKVWKKILRSGLPLGKAAFYLSQFYFQNASLKKALKWAEIAVSKSPRNRQYLYLLGRIYLRMIEKNEALTPNQLKRAVRIWTKLYEMARNRTERRKARFRLFEIYRAQGTLYRLTLRLQDRLKTSPRDVEALRTLAEYYFWRSSKSKWGQNLYRAKYYYQKILKIKPKDLDALLSLEEIASKNNNWREASRYLQRLIKLDPQRKKRYYRKLTDYSLKVGDFRKAVFYAKKIVQLDPESPSSYAELARVYSKIGDIKSAIKIYKKLLQLSPHSYSYALILADLLKLQNKNREALRYYRLVYRNAKDGNLIYEAALRTIELLQFQKKLKQLELEFKNLIESNPKELAYFKALAEIYRRQGQSKKYLQAFIKAAANVEQKSQIYRQLAITAREQGDIKRAIVYYKKMLEESPSPNPEDKITLSKMYFQVHDLKNVKKILLQLLSEYPYSLRIIRRVALLLDQYQLTREAIAAYEQFLDLQPYSTTARLKLAKLYLQTGEITAAKGILNSIIWKYYDLPIRKNKKKIKRIPVTFPYYLRRRYYPAGNIPLPLLSKEHQKALDTLIEIHLREGSLGQFEKRLEAELPFKSMRFRRQMIDEISRIYRKHKLIGRLKRLIEKTIKSSPHHPRWLLYLADLHFKQREYRRALQLYNRVAKFFPKIYHRVLIKKLEILLILKRNSQAKRILQRYLHFQLSFPPNFTEIVQILEKYRQYKLLYETVRWAQRYSQKNSPLRHSLIMKLAEIYQKLNDTAGLKTLLLNQMDSKSYYYIPKIENLIKFRRQVIGKLWPLLNRAERKSLVKNRISSAKKALEKGNKAELKVSLVDLMLFSELNSEPEKTAQYLYALWKVVGGREFRRRALEKLFKLGNEKLALQLLKEQLSKLPPIPRLFNLLSTLEDLQRAELLPPRSLNRFVERNFLKLKSKVPNSLWWRGAETLLNYYIRWNDYQRAIWWGSSCLWGQDDREVPPEMVLLYARAYSLYGYKKKAHSLYRKGLGAIWERFTRSPDSFLREKLLEKTIDEYLKIFTIKREIEKFRLKWLLQYFVNLRLRRQKLRKRDGVKTLFSKRVLERFHFQSFRILKKYWKKLKKVSQTPYSLANTTVTPLFEIYKKAENTQILLKNLIEFWKNSTNEREQQLRLLYLLIAYQKAYRAGLPLKNLARVIELIRPAVEKLSLEREAGAHYIYALLLVRAGKYRRAEKIFKKLLMSAKKERRKILIALRDLYQKQKARSKLREVQFQLSTQFKSKNALYWLAEDALRRKNLGQTVKFYQKFLRTTKNKYWKSPTLRRSWEYLQLSLFLLPSFNWPQVLYYADLSWFHLQSAADISSEQYFQLLSKILKLYLDLDVLNKKVTLWKSKYAHGGKTLHLLFSIALGYRLLQKKDELLSFLPELQRYYPGDERAFLFIISQLYMAGQYQKASAILEKYKNNPELPKNFYLWKAFLIKKVGGEKRAVREKFRRAVVRQEELCREEKAVNPASRCTNYIWETLLYNGLFSKAIDKLKQLLNTPNFQFKFFFIRYDLKFLEKSKKGRYLGKVYTAARNSDSWLKELSLTLAILKSYLKSVWNSYLNSPQYYRHLLKSAKPLLVARYNRTSQAVKVFKFLAAVGLPITGEKFLWQNSLQQGQKEWSSAFPHLCRYWKRSGLYPLCYLALSGSKEKVEKIFSKNSSLELEYIYYRYKNLTSGESDTILRKLRELSLKLGREEEFRELSALIKFRGEGEGVGGERSQAAGLTGKRGDRPNHGKSEGQRNTGDFRAKGGGERPRSEAWTAGRRKARREWRITVPDRCPGMYGFARKAGEKVCYLFGEKRNCRRKIVVFKGRVIFNDCRGGILAVEAKSGRPLWEVRLPTKGRFRFWERPPLRWIPKIHPLLKTISSFSFGELNIVPYYQLVDLAPLPDGKLLAVFNLKFLESGVRWGSGLFAGLYAIAIEPDEGRIVWEREHPGMFGLGGIVLTDGGFSVLGRNYSHFSLKDGRSLWTAEGPLLSLPWLFTDPLVPGHTTCGGKFFAFKKRTVYAIDGGGKVVWRRRLPLPITSISCGGGAGLVVTDLSGELWVLSNSPGGRTLWKKRVPIYPYREREVLQSGYYVDAERVSRPVERGGAIYSAGSDGIFRVHSLRDGSLLWRVNVGMSPRSDLHFLGNSKVFFQVLDGSVAVIDLRGRKLERFIVPEVLSDIQLLEKKVRNGTFAIDVRERALYFGWELGGVFSVRKILLEERGNIQGLEFFKASMAGDSRLEELIRERGRPEILRLYWSYFFLLNSKNFSKALDKFHSIWRGYQLLSLFYKYGRSKGLAEVKAVLWAGILTSPQRSIRLGVINRWLKLMRDWEREELFRIFYTSLGIKTLNYLLKEGRGELERVMAAETLAILGENGGRKFLYKFLRGVGESSQKLKRELAIFVVRTLFRWDYFLDWEGAAKLEDLELVKELLDSSLGEIRARAALFLGEVASEFDTYRKLRGVRKLRERLREAVKSLRFLKGYLAAEKLALLGDKEGYLEMRRLYQSQNNFFRTMLARRLLSVFEDFLGFQAILDIYRGQNYLNERLPAFRIILIGRLQKFKHLKKAKKLCSESEGEKLFGLSPVHRAYLAFECGKVYLNLKKFRRAELEFEKVLKLDPLFIDVLDYKVELYYKMKEYRKAAELGEKAIIYFPETSPLLFYAAASHLSLGNPQWGEERFKRAMSTYKYSSKFRYYYAKFLVERYKKSGLDRKYLNRALKYLKEAERLFPYSSKYIVLRGDIYALMGNYEKARAAYREVLAREAPLSPLRKEVEKKLSNISLPQLLQGRP